MKKFLKYIKLNDDLLKLYSADQKERNEYQSYLKKIDNWQNASKKWIKDKNRNQNDIFNDKFRSTQAKKLIIDNIKEIIVNKKLLNMAWLLVQHMDNDVSFQKQFLNYLQPQSQEYKYLFDRIAVNSGEEQQYNTQNFLLRKQKFSP